MKKIYLDYAATTPVRPEVVKAMAPYWSEKFGNPSSLHSFGQEAREAVEEAREKVAKVLNCLPEEIIFTGTTTTSDNLAILGVINAHQHLTPSTPPAMLRPPAKDWHCRAGKAKRAGHHLAPFKQWFAVRHWDRWRD